MDDGIEDRVRALERAVAELRQTGAPRPVVAEDADLLWALSELERRSPDTVLMVGSLDVPETGPVRWQYALRSASLLDADWTEVAATVDALAHAARLAILRFVLSGIRTTAQLLEQESVGTTGQLHHHLRQLVAAGWLTSTRRGHYEVPGPRVVPLLVMIMAATR